MQHALLSLLLATFSRCQLFEDAFDHVLLRFTATNLHNGDTSFCAARAVGARCVPVLYMGKMTGLLSLREKELQARLLRGSQAEQHAPLLSEEQVKRHLQFLRSDNLLAPSPYICVAEWCSLAASVSREEEELPVIVWRSSDSRRRSLYYDGKLLSLDEHHIPGVHAALRDYRKEVSTSTAGTIMCLS